MTKCPHCETERLCEAATILLSEIDASSEINAIVAASNPLRRILATLEFTDAPLEDDPDALTVAYMAGEAKARGRLAAAEADAERLAEVLREIEESLCEGFCKDLPRDTYAPEMSIDCGAWARAALAAHEARKGERHE